MALSNLQLQTRIEAIETALNTLQNALNNLVSKPTMKALQNIRQQEIETLQTNLTTMQSEIEVLQEEFVEGITLNLSATQIDLIEAAIDHGSILGLTDNDHTQYYNDVTAPLVESGQVLTLDVDLSDFSISDGKLTLVTDVITDHSLLSNLNSANYSHLTSTQLTGLTDGNDTTLHTHGIYPNIGGTPVTRQMAGWTSGTKISGIEIIEYTDSGVEVDGYVSYSTQTKPPSAITNTPAGITQTISFNNGPVQVLNLSAASGDVAITLSDPVESGTYLLQIIQGANSRAVTFTGVYWPAATAPTITTDEGAIDFISFVYINGAWYGSAVQAMGIPA